MASTNKSERKKPGAMADMKQINASEPNVSRSDVMTAKAKTERIFGAWALMLTIGFLWTDIRAMFPWFEALVDKMAG